MRWLFDYFSKFVNNSLCYIFQKQASKDHLTQGNLLKTTLLNEKQSNLEKEMYGNISLYSQYFSPEAGSNVHKTYFYFLKLTKKYFVLSSWIKKPQCKLKNIHVTHTADWNVSLRRSKLFYLHFQINDLKTTFRNNFSSKLDTFGNT